MKLQYDIDYVRNQFPCHERKVNGYQAAFFDAPGGSQVPKNVADRVYDYLLNHNANIHGCYATSIETDEMIYEARETLGAFLGCEGNEISFGANTTSNVFKLAMAIARDLEEGDEVIITEIDHIGNRSPWKMLEEKGIIVKSVSLDKETNTLDFNDYKEKLTAKTKVVAVNWASNALGTITDVKKYVDLAHDVGALTVVDAVHYAAHKPIDVKAIGTDFLVCSVYKFFGPHIGVVYTQKDVMKKLRTIRVDADDNTEAPYKFETGTYSIEGAWGAVGAVQFIAGIGRKHLQYFEERLSNEQGLRKEIIAGMLSLDEYEEVLANKLRTELRKIEKVKIFEAVEGNPRTTTVSIQIENKNSAEVAQHLAEKGIFVWDGNFYAVDLVDNVLGLKDGGGLVRIGFAPYNTEEEVNRLIAEIKTIASM